MGWIDYGSIRRNPIISQLVECRGHIAYGGGGKEEWLHGAREGGRRREGRVVTAKSFRGETMWCHRAVAAVTEMQLARGEHQSQVWGLCQDQVPEPVLRNARHRGSSQSSRTGTFMPLSATRQISLRQGAESDGGSQGPGSPARCRYR